MTTPTSTETTAFRAALEQALNHYSDAQWLGEHSPLASPYFLGRRLVETAVEQESTNAVVRGTLLQTLLVEATALIQTRNAERLRTILNEYYFNDRPFDLVAQKIGLARNSFHLSRNTAIACLEGVLIRQINPALRLETPPTLGLLLDRSLQAAQCLAILRKGQTVGVIGGGGVGKTTFASHITKQMGRPIFWFTLRPGLNDHLNTLLFALGYFLHGLGSSALWLELVAATAQLPLERIWGVAKYSFEQLRSKPPLLCIDEFDLLQPAQEVAHVPIVEFVQSLRGITPLLLVGQQPKVDTDFFCVLTGLSLTSTQELLAQNQIVLQESQFIAIHTATHGNPRLLELVMALYNTGDSVVNVLSNLSSQPSLEFLLGRMLQRLNDHERGLLMELSVFQRSAPAAFWNKPAVASAKQRLLSLHLLQHDSQGGIALLPTYRSLIYSLLPTDKRQQLHLQAANIRATYGEMMDAVNHLVEANEAEKAIWLWYEHRHILINHGYARKAMALMKQIRSDSFSPQTLEMLTLLQAELEQLTGDRTRALEDIHSILWKTPVLAIEANYLIGMITTNQHDFVTSEKAFRNVLATAEKLIGTRIVSTHRGIAWGHLNEREFEKATYELARARYELEQCEGDLQFDLNKYQEAERLYLAAMHTAESISHTVGIADTANRLVGVYIRQGRLDELRTFLTKAEQLFQKLGMIVRATSLNLNRATMHNMAGEYDQALATVQNVLTQLARFGQPLPVQIAIAHQIMAESHLGLKNLTEAAEYARKVVETEDITLLPEAYRTYGEALAQKGQYADAQQFIRNAIELATNNEDRLLMAYGWRALGQVHLCEQKADLATEAFTQAIELFSEIDLPNEVERTKQFM